VHAIEFDQLSGALSVSGGSFADRQTSVIVRGQYRSGFVGLRRHVRLPAS
jgi:hypothetical protein